MNTLLITEFQVICTKKLRATEGEKNEDQIHVIKKMLNKMKKTLKRCLRIEKL